MSVRITVNMQKLELYRKVQGDESVTHISAEALLIIQISGHRYSDVKLQ